MEEIILPSAVFEFTWLAIDGFMEIHSSPNKERPQEIWNFISP